MPGVMVFPMDSRRTPPPPTYLLSGGSSSTRRASCPDLTCATGGGWDAEEVGEGEANTKLGDVHCIVEGTSQRKQHERNSSGVTCDLSHVLELFLKSRWVQGQI